MLYTILLAFVCCHFMFGLWQTLWPWKKDESITEKANKEPAVLSCSFCKPLESSTSDLSVWDNCCSVTLCNPMDYSTTGFPVLHYLPEFAQTHVHWVSKAIQPSHPLSPPSSLVLNLSQHHDLFQWVSSLHQVAEVLELQLQRQSFQWMLRVDFL